MFRIGLGILLFSILLACASPGSWLSFVAILIGLIGLAVIVGSTADKKGDDVAESNDGDNIGEQE